MTIDISKIKPGDTVHVKMVVGATGYDTSTAEKLLWTEEGFGIDTDDIISHIPKPREWKVGDRVSVGNTAGNAIILALWSDSAWVQKNGEPFTAALRELTLLED